MNQEVYITKRILVGARIVAAVFCLFRDAGCAFLHGITPQAPETKPSLGISFPDFDVSPGTMELKEGRLHPKRQVLP